MPQEDALRLEAESWIEQADSEDLVELYLEWKELVEIRDELVETLEEARAGAEEPSQYEDQIEENDNDEWDGTIDGLEEIIRTLPNTNIPYVYSTPPYNGERYWVEYNTPQWDFVSVPTVTINGNSPSYQIAENSDRPYTQRVQEIGDELRAYAQTLAEQTIMETLQNQCQEE